MIGEGHWETERVIDLVEAEGGENVLLSGPILFRNNVIQYSLIIDFIHYLL